MRNPRLLVLALFASLVACDTAVEPTLEQQTVAPAAPAAAAADLAGVEAGALAFGPEAFRRSTGQPATETRYFSTDGLEPPFTLRLQNGEPSGEKRVSSAQVVLDGVALFGPSDFNQQVSLLSTVVEPVEQPSTLEVTLAGEPGGEVTVWIEHAGGQALLPVSSEGGTFDVSGGALELTVPEDALSEPVTLTAEPVAPDALEGTAEGFVPGTVFDLGPDGTRFDAPVTVTISFDPARVPEDVSVAALRLFVLEGGEWSAIRGSAVDPDAGTVSGPVSHFSTFAILPEALVEVTAGQFHACGLGQSGSAYCWGTDQGEISPETGVLGGATTSESCLVDFAGDVDTWPCTTTPLQVPGGLVFRDLDAGASFYTCGITDADELFCWGQNHSGQIGDGTTSFRSTPTRVPGLSAAAVSAGWRHTCALTTAGETLCWGRNGDGELGTETTEVCGAGSVPCSTSPVRVGGPGFASISAGLSLTCALTPAGEPYCWGWNAHGQLGDGTFTSRSEPQPVSGGLILAEISAGAIFACGRDLGGAAHCWGNNEFAGALGDGSGQNSAVPVAVAGGLAFDEISASATNNGFAHVCGVSVRTVFCWGGNNFDELGVKGGQDTCTFTNFFGDEVSSPCTKTPVEVPTTALFAAVETGMNFTCSLTPEGEAWCWGRNDAGQLGIGTTEDTNIPEPVSLIP